ncbi:hypothetical protein BWI97_04260 [Siphonobacter sp. BAB-5405]|uniref:M56 family metallopeptidase n=1 Tax=Siphonobacter sp. BAB-5405 TaxID=1864825 RepID=UPI000C7FD86F|nr:M56 family metallopeptidase [Siphonobacter sp. BAB-5405]PMD98380.1 hypothetical protein BWI97_04260 [Siphonobacter sp. BAB-5405]
MNWLHYLLQVNLYLAGFYGFYCILLRRETFHQLNRSFLLAGTALAFFIPAIQSDWVRSWFVTQQVNESIYAYYNPGVVFIRPDYLDNHESVHPLAWGHVLAVVYMCGMLFLLGKFAFQLMRLSDLIRYRYHRKANTAFAFFNHFFVGKNLPNRQTIEAHERVHVRQLHSADVIFFELVAIINWFNPLVYLMKQDIRLLHEYLADEVASKCEPSRADYAMLLFSQQFGVNTTDLVHPFFNKSLLKPRISMLQKTPSSTAALGKYGLIFPVFGTMLFLSTAFSEQVTAQSQPATPATSSQKPAKTSQPAPDPDVYTVVDKAAGFPGGQRAMYDFLAKTVKYPKPAARANVGGRVFTRFVVEKDGSLSNIEIAKGLGFGCDEEALRVLNAMPKWEPGIVKGETVRSYYNLPIFFKMDKKKTAKTSK